MAAPGLVRSYGGGNSGATSVTTQFGSSAGNPTAGNYLVACVAYRTVTGVTVTASGWTGQTAVANGTTGGHRILTKVADGTETTTNMAFQLAASVKASVIVLELSASAQALKDLATGSSQASNATHSGPALAAPLSDDLII